MTIVAGVDFGTLNVRVSVFDSMRGRLATAVAEYPLYRNLYFALGQPDATAVPLVDALPELRRISAEVLTQRSG